MIVVSNAGPIIALSRIGRLNLLKLLYEIVHVSTVVKDEICSCSDKPGYDQILSSKWIHVLDVSDNLAAKKEHLIRLLEAVQRCVFFLDASAWKITCPASPVDRDYLSRQNMT